MATLQQRTLDPHQCTCKGNTSQLALVIHRLGIRNSDYQQLLMMVLKFEGGNLPWNGTQKKLQGTPGVICLILRLNM